MNEAFIKRTITLRGEKEGREWLEMIPKLVSEFEQRWEIKVGEPFPELSVNYVAPASKKDGSKVILKIGYAKDKEFQSEIEALYVFNGEGIVKVLEIDLVKGVVLLETLEPGRPLSELEDDEEATRILASVMKKIWREAPFSYEFPTLWDWYEDFDWFLKNYPQGSETLPSEMAKQGKFLFMSLLEKPNGQYLLHGDLHHENVLSATREPWLAIDPKGVIGEREYEVAAMLRNPYKKLLSKGNVKEVLERRLDILSDELDFERNRLAKWGFAQTILSIIWNHQSGAGRDKPWFEVAKVLQQLI